MAASVTIRDHLLAKEGAVELAVSVHSQEKGTAWTEKSVSQQCQQGPTALPSSIHPESYVTSSCSKKRKKKKKSICLKHSIEEL